MGLAGNIISPVQGEFVGTSTAVPGTGTNQTSFLQQLGAIANFSGIAVGGSALGNTSAGAATSALLQGNPAQATINAITGTTSTSGQSTVSAIFLRGVIVILGFIFVAVGLSLFSKTQVFSRAK